MELTNNSMTTENNSVSVARVAGLVPFSEEAIDYLNAVSRILMKDAAAKAYPDVITLGFWMRRASMEALKNRFMTSDDNRITLGRGKVFHIAPSNVAVNFAYSAVAAFVCGNTSIVRLPSKDFPQVEIIVAAFEEAVKEFPQFEDSFEFIRYGHEKERTDEYSADCDVRVIWGGDNTIAEIRKSPLAPRATEITFADRYSLAVIDVAGYLAMTEEEKDKAALDFYNDTYLTDQNACTSPRAVVWRKPAGSDEASLQQAESAQNQFWNRVHRILVEGTRRYDIAGVQSVNKLTSAYMAAAVVPGVKCVTSEDNLIVRIKVPEGIFTDELMKHKDNSGYFFEYSVSEVSELKEFCDNASCQTISYLGMKPVDFKELICSGISGVDRVVPMGTTMDFDLIWDGYNLFERLTRVVGLK